MTPLAHAVMRELLIPAKRRSMDDRAGVIDRMDDVHCFEVTGIVEAAQEIAKAGIGRETPDVAMFLPAPKTWIEWCALNGRNALLLEETANPHVFRATAVDNDYGQLWSYDRGWFHPARQATTPDQLYRRKTLAELDPNGQEWVRAVLALINTPRIVGRRQHMPHRGLERRLLKERKNIGRFPLNAWTEILLHVTPPKDASGEASREAHLTGQRALHFCRAHLRIRGGRLEMVRAHWRGDPSLGIKRSRYRVAA